MHMLIKLFQIKLAGEDLPDELELKSRLFKNVMRNAISEYMNAEMTTTCWIKNVMDVTDSLKVTLKSKLMSGFV